MFQKFSKSDIGEIIATLQDKETHGMAFMMLQSLSAARPKDIMEFDQQIMKGMKVKIEMSSQGANILVDLAKANKVSS